MLNSVFIFLFAAFALWLLFVLAVSRTNPNNAHKVVKAAGMHFPFRRRSRRKR